LHQSIDDQFDIEIVEMSNLVDDVFEHRLFDRLIVAVDVAVVVSDVVVVGFVVAAVAFAVIVGGSLVEYVVVVQDLSYHLYYLCQINVCSLSMMLVFVPAVNIVVVRHYHLSAMASFLFQQHYVLVRVLVVYQSHHMDQ